MVLTFLFLIQFIRLVPCECLQRLKQTNSTANKLAGNLYQPRQNMSGLSPDPDNNTSKTFLSPKSNSVGLCFLFLIWEMRVCFHLVKQSPQYPLCETTGLLQIVLMHIMCLERCLRQVNFPMRASSLHLKT